jgi:hypothetical protein
MLLFLFNFLKQLKLKIISFKAYVFNRFKEKPVSTLILFGIPFLIGFPIVFILGGWQALVAYAICRLTGVCPL